MINGEDVARAHTLGHIVSLTRRGGWGVTCECGWGLGNHGKRRKADVQAAARQHIEEVIR